MLSPLPLLHHPSPTRQDEKALLKVEFGDLTFRADEKRFRMSEKEWGSVPAGWKKVYVIDVVFPDTLENAVGLGNYPWR